MSNTTLPNPFTPQAYLEPNVAVQHQTSQYVHVATLSAFIWDILLYGPQDFQLLFRQRPSLSSAVYFSSRITTLLYVTMTTIIEVSPVANCQVLETIIGWGLVAGTATTTLLFFIRVRAIFIGSKWIVRFFALLWLANLGAVIAVPFALSSAHIGPTPFCMNTGVKSWTAVTLIITAINDTLVFAFVSYVLISTTTSTPPGVKNAAKAFFMGKDLPEISRVLLQGGQQYYFMTVGVNIFTMVLKVIPSVPPIYRAMFSSPNLALENSMACRVYRNIKFGISRDPAIPSLNPPHNSNSNSNSGRSRSRSNTVSASLEHKYTRRMGGQRTRISPRFDAVDELGVETFTLQPSAFGKGRGRPLERSFPGSGGVKIEVTRTIERDDDRSDYDLDPTKVAKLGDCDV